MQGCKVRAPKVLKFFTLKSQKLTSTREELKMKNNGGYQAMTPRSRFQRFPSLRGGIDL
jgi:hypothetical protein